MRKARWLVLLAVATGCAGSVDDVFSSRLEALGFFDYADSPADAKS